MKILKLGGSLLTEKHSGIPRYKKTAAASIAKEIAAYKGSLIIVHGAGSFGHPLAKKGRLHRGMKSKMQRKIFCRTQGMMHALTLMVCSTLLEKGILAFPVQASSSSIMKKGRLEHLDTIAISIMLKNGITPVLCGVPSIDSARGSSILSGDKIAVFLAKKLKAESIVFASDVAGICSKDPSKSKNAKLIPFVSRATKGFSAGKSTGIDVTGGMKGKLHEILASGITAQIVSGRKKGNILAAMEGKHVGTMIK